MNEILIKIAFKVIISTLYYFVESFMTMLERSFSILILIAQPPKMTHFSRTRVHYQSWLNTSDFNDSLPNLIGCVSIAF